MTTRSTEGAADAADMGRRVAKVAARQHGVVTRSDLMAIGMRPDTIRSWLRSGRIAPLHRGVYLLGSLVGTLRPAWHREMAAVLACGRSAAVSQWSALWLRRLVPAKPGGPSGAVHLSLTGGRCRQTGIIAHRVSALPPEDVEIVDGIPATKLPRTILDVAQNARPRSLEQVIARAERMGQLDRSALVERLEQAGPIPGTRLLRAILSGTSPPAFTRSEAEERFLELVRSAELPEPESNASVGGLELDFLWRTYGVAVEVDGFAYHSSRPSFERDRARDFALGAEGVQVHRVTWRQIEATPHVVVSRLASVLTRAELMGTAARDAATSRHR